MRGVEIARVLWLGLMSQCFYCRICILLARFCLFEVSYTALVFSWKEFG